MKHLLNLPIDESEAEIQKQAEARGGTLPLDFSDPLHYQFYINTFGGEAFLQENAPAFYQLIQERKSYDSNKENTPAPESLCREAPIKLEDYTIISHTGTETLVLPAGPCGQENEAELCYRIESGFEASYSSHPAAAVHIKARIMDCTAKRFIQEKSIHILPDQKHLFSADIDVIVPDRKYKREHPYRTSAIFSAMSPAKNGTALLTPSYVTSVTYTVCANDDIKEIQLLHPQNQNASKRTEHTDNICISYKRDGLLQSPDYTYDVDLQHLIKEMPVHMELSFTVALQNDAYFKPDSRNSYFFKDYDPQIYLARFDNDKGEVISEGRALLIQDWISFTEDNVEVLEKDKNQNATKLKLTFPDNWKSNLKKNDWFNTSTYGDFYAMISFNTCNKDSAGNYYDEATTIFIRFLDNAKARSNPTPPGVNSIHVPRLYYQWGCFGKDTILLSRRGPIAASGVRLHDWLKSRDGRWIEVEDIYSGNETEILCITHEKGEIRLTPDHTLFGEHGVPMTAGSAKPGTRLLYINPGTGAEELVTVLQASTVPYGDKVYNFKFSQAEALIASGLVAGDHGWQQKLRPDTGIVEPRLMNEVIHKALGELESLETAKSSPFSSAPPSPVFSNHAECLTLHYFALKALARYRNLYTEEEAQAIAEYCQYIGDNASTGGIRVKNAPLPLDSAGLCLYYIDESGTAQYIIPVIPTAMAKWYDNDELAKEKPWLLPTDPDFPEQKYKVPDHILAPFHYPPGSEDSSQTEFDSPCVEQLLTAVQKEAQTRGFHKNTLMAMGIALHILADSMLHEGFSPYHDWRNLGRIEQIIGPDGSDITAAHKPYNPGGTPFPFGEYSETTVYPAGIQENGDVSHCSYARYSYFFPMDTGELPMDETGILQYNGYQSRMNPSRYVRTCKRMLQFLCACKGRPFDETTWKQILASALGNIFGTKADTPEEIQKMWSGAFPNISFSYDPKTVYKRLTEGDTSQADEGKRFEEFFGFTLLLHRIKKGEELFD